MPVTPGGRWSPNDGDDFDLTTDLAAMQVSNESATAVEMEASASYRTMTNAARLALSGAQLREGLLVWTTDTRLRHLYTNGAWRSETNWTTAVITAATYSQHPTTPLQYRTTLDRVSLRGAVYKSGTAPAFENLFQMPTSIPSPYSQLRTVIRLDNQQQALITSARVVQLGATNPLTTGTGFLFDGVGYDL